MGLTPDQAREFSRLILENMYTAMERDLLFGSSRDTAPPLGLRQSLPMPLLESDGRDRPVDFISAIDADQVLSDVLDAEVVVRMKNAPEDPLDKELHLEECVPCAKMYGRLLMCSRCLEVRVCTRTDAKREGARVRYRDLCRSCRNDGDSLVVLDHGAGPS